MTISILLNYLFGEEVYENLEISADSAAFNLAKFSGERIAKAFEEKFGVSVMDVVHTLDHDRSIRIDGGILRMSCCGIVISIDIVKNLEILSGLLFDHFFVWMADLWHMATTPPTSDPRDSKLSKSDYKLTIERQYERVCELRTAYKARIGSNYDVLPVNDFMPETDE